MSANPHVSYSLALDEELEVPSTVVSRTVHVAGAREAVGEWFGHGRALPLWARVAGNFVDGAMLALSAKARHLNRKRVVEVATGLAGVIALDIVAVSRARGWL